MAHDWKFDHFRGWKRYLWFCTYDERDDCRTSHCWSWRVRPVPWVGLHLRYSTNPHILIKHSALTYVTVYTSLKERPIYNAAIGLCWGAGAILGPLVGGGFSESSATWRWAFYINLPLAALVSPVYIFLFPKYNSKPDIPGPTKLAQIDWVGVFLNAGVWALFQVACTFSGSVWKWNSAGPISLWVVFAVFLIALVIQQTWAITTTYERRLIPLQLLRSRTIVLLYIAASCAATCVAVAVYFLPLFFVFTKGDSAIKAAVRLLPFIVRSPPFRISHLYISKLTPSTVCNDYFRHDRWWSPPRRRSLHALLCCCWRVHRHRRRSHAHCRCQHLRLRYLRLRSPDGHRRRNRNATHVRRCGRDRPTPRDYGRHRSHEHCANRKHRHCTLDCERAVPEYRVPESEGCARWERVQ